jgi:hypothetical protein
MVSAPIVRVPIRGLELRRTVYLYAVAGRQRSFAASALLRMLRPRAANVSELSIPVFARTPDMTAVPVRAAA